MTVYLESITVRFPATDAEFVNGFVSLTELLGWKQDRTSRLSRSNQEFYPELAVAFESACPDILTDFGLSNGKTISVRVENVTGLDKPSPHSYQHLSVETVKQRLVASGIRLVGVDHVGFNLPWFSPGIHPRIVQLRQELTSRCLYHRYPTGEPWDFIIPGDIDEIADHKRLTIQESEGRNSRLFRSTVLRFPCFSLTSAWTLAMKGSHDCSQNP